MAKVLLQDPQGAAGPACAMAAVSNRDRYNASFKSKGMYAFVFSSSYLRKLTKKKLKFIVIAFYLTQHTLINILMCSG